MKLVQRCSGNERSSATSLFMMALAEDALRAFTLRLSSLY